MHIDLVEAYPDFIGLDAAKKETRIRVQSLLTDTVQHLRSKSGRRMERLKAAKRLHDCLEGSFPCHSPACLVCTRQFQASAYQRLCEQFTDCRPLYHVTLVHDRYMVEAGQLDEASPRRVINTLRQQIKRAGLSHGKAVGSYEAEFRLDMKRWIPHTHLIVANLNKIEIKRLRRWYCGKTLSGSHRMVIQEIANTPEDLARVFTYPFKWRTYGRDVIFLPDGSKTRGRAYRLPKPIENELLLFLNAHRFENLTYTIGFSSRGAFWKAAEHSQFSGKAAVPPSTGWSTYTPAKTGIQKRSQTNLTAEWHAKANKYLKG